VSLARARAAKSQAAARLPELADRIVGVGVTRVGEDYAVKLNLREPPPHALPAEIDGVPLCVDVVGQIRTQAGDR